MPRLGLIFPHLAIADGCNGGCGLGVVRRPFRPHMPPSLTPGSSIVVSVQNTDVDIGLRHGPKGCKSKEHHHVSVSTADKIAWRLLVQLLDQALGSWNNG
jgi:hypothetical protein